MKGEARKARVRHIRAEMNRNRIHLGETDGDSNGMRVGNPGFLGRELDKATRVGRER